MMLMLGLFALIYSARAKPRLVKRRAPKAPKKQLELQPIASALPKHKREPIPPVELQTETHPTDPQKARPTANVSALTLLPHNTDISLPVSRPVADVPLKRSLSVQAPHAVPDIA